MIGTGTEATVGVGTLIDGRYRLETSLGAGGMAEVFEATHTGLHQMVAVKILRSQFAQDPIHRQRFEREARAAAALRSEHVVNISDVGVHDGTTPYIVMERLQGIDLADHLERDGPMAPRHAITLVLAVCKALSEAHSKGVIHRDLKPANLFLAQSNDRQVLKVLDFGISKVESDGSVAAGATGLTGTLTVMGTPAYMSPEQTRSTKTVDGRTDIWALGCVLYELVSGISPYAAESIPDIMVKILTQDPVPLALLRPDEPLMAELDAILTQCLQKEPADRTPTVDALAESLAMLLSDDAGGNAAVAHGERSTVGGATSRVVVGPPLRAGPYQATAAQLVPHTTTDGTQFALPPMATPKPPPPGTKRNQSAALVVAGVAAITAATAFAGFVFFAANKPSGSNRHGGPGVTSSSVVVVSNVEATDISASTSAPVVAATPSQPSTATAPARRTVGDAVGDVGDVSGVGVGVATAVKASAVPSQSGSLPSSVVRRVVESKAGRYRACYNHALRADPNLAGRVTIRFVINGRGQVASAHGSGIPGVAQCVTQVFRTLTFPPPDGGGSVRVTYPLSFQSK